MELQRCTTDHDFVLVLRGIADVTPEIETAIFEAGCDDATLSVRGGCVFVTFSRKALSIKDAILTAIHDVRKANIGAEVLRVDICNLVTQSDIARKIDRPRQMVHQYIMGIRGPGSFPPPACHICDGAPLWYWCEVSYWLWQNDIIKEDVFREAQEVAAINSLLEWMYQRRTDRRLADEIFKELAEA